LSRKPRLSAQQQSIRRGTGLDIERRVLYTIHEGPQRAFMESEAEELLYGGAFGGGKSVALRAWAVTYCLTYPGATVALFRRSYRELSETHSLALQREVPLTLATYSSGEHVMHFTNGSILMLRYCETDSDVETYQTAEFDAILFDELTQFTQNQYVGLLARLRSSKPWWPGPRVRAAATPLGIGHDWVKARWIDSAPPFSIWIAPPSEGGMTRQFIPAKVTDNPTLLRADPDYQERLRSLPEEEYKARVLGSWDVFTGQYFRRWRDELHAIEPFDIPPDWDRFIGVDYGFAAPYCVLWIARPPGTHTAFVYREHYGVGIDAQTQAELAWEATKDASEKLKAVVLDPSMFGKVNAKGERMESIASDWKRFFGTTTKVIPGNNERIAGWKLMREMIDWKDGPNGMMIAAPRLFVFRTCSNLVRTIPRLIQDEHNVEDLDTEGEDHAADAARYVLRHAFAGAGRQGAALRFAFAPRGGIQRVGVA